MMTKSSSTTSKHQFRLEIIPRCLTDRCQDCSGLYHSEVLQVQIRCNCICHRYSKEHQSQGEKLIGANSSVGSPEEPQSVATTNPNGKKEAAIAPMDNCSNTLLKTVNVGPASELHKAAREEIASLVTLQEEALRLKQFEKLVQKCEVQN